jgi:hypothetical protein
MYTNTQHEQQHKSVLTSMQRWFASILDSADRLVNAHPMVLTVSPSSPYDPDTPRGAQPPHD